MRGLPLLPHLFVQPLIYLYQYGREYLFYTLDCIQYYLPYFAVQRVLGLTIGNSSSWCTCPLMHPYQCDGCFFNTFVPSDTTVITFSSVSMHHHLSNVILLSSDCNSPKNCSSNSRSQTHHVLQQNHWHADLNSSLEVQVNGGGFPQVIGNSHDFTTPPTSQFSHFFILRVSSVFTPSDKCSSCHNS